MVTKHQYKRYGKGGNFKDQGQGLRASVDAIRQQRQIEIDALKIQAGKQKEIDKQKIANESNNARIVRDNKNILQDLNNKIYKTKLDALQVRADREVKSILGQAENEGKKAKFWDKFATEYAQALGKTATELGEFGQFLHAVNNDKWNRKNNPEKHKEFAAAMQAMYNINDAEALNASFKGEWDDINILNIMVKKQDRSNKRNAEWEVDKVISNINTFTNVIERTNAGRLNANNINLIYENAAYLLLYQRGIPFNSAEATRLLDTMNFKANAQAELWRNKDKFDNDLKDNREFAEKYVALHKKLTVAKPEEIEDLEKALDIRHKQFHQLLRSSYYDLGNNRYGPVQFNPQQLNDLVLDLTFDAFNFTDVTEAVETYNRLKIFKPEDGFTIKVKGQTVGMVDKSGTLEEAIANRVAINEKRQQDLQKVIEQDKRQEKINPILGRYEEVLAIARNDKSTKEQKREAFALLNDDEFQKSIERLATDFRFKNTHELNRLYEIIGYSGDKQIHGTIEEFLDITGLIYSGRQREALNYLLRSTKRTGNFPQGFDLLFDKASLLEDLNEQGTTIIKGAEGLLDAHLKATRGQFGPVGFNQEMYNRMETLVSHSLITLMFNDGSKDSAQKKYERAYAKLESDLQANKGLFAIRQASTYVPPDIDPVTNKPIPGSDYRPAKDLKDKDRKVYDTKGSYFLAVDNYIIPNAKVNPTNINDIFFKQGGTLEQNLKDNFNDSEKSIISVDQKRAIVRSAIETNYEGDLPAPIQLIITRAKIADPNTTTYEVMNKVLGAIISTEGFGSYAGISWTPTGADITKRVVGSCTINDKDNFTKCLMNLQTYDIKEAYKKGTKKHEEAVKMHEDLMAGTYESEEQWGATDKQLYDILLRQKKMEDEN